MDKKSLKKVYRFEEGVGIVEDMVEFGDKVEGQGIQVL